MEKAIKRMSVSTRELGRLLKSVSQLSTKAVTFDDVLKSMGAKVSADALESVKSDLLSATQYKAQNSLANNLKQATDAAVTNIVNNGNTINNPVFNINGVNDPEQITKAIHDYLWETFTGLGNSVK